MSESLLHRKAKEIIKDSIGLELVIPVSFARWDNCKQPCNAIKIPYFTIQSVEVEKRFPEINKRVDAFVLLSNDVETIELVLEFKFTSPKTILDVFDFSVEGLSVVEIDLEKKREDITDWEESVRTRYLPPRTLRDRLLFMRSNKQWLCHAEYGINFQCKHPLGCPTRKGVYLPSGAWHEHETPIVMCDCLCLFCDPEMKEYPTPNF